MNDIVSELICIFIKYMKLDIKCAYLNAKMNYGPDCATLFVIKLPKELWGIGGIQENIMKDDNLAIVEKTLYDHPESGQLFNDLLDSVMLVEPEVERL